ncbi:sulfatase-like hydrolase/transferase [Streptomyces sp. NPDC057027]|uniref:sulfatase-like hydrolase/transferase n=1 Tax=Streptomyces sp. NPDC057027 TaxID=3346004 RepID=UPI00362ABC15
MRPHIKAPVAEILRLNGYSTAQSGKCHEVPVWQTSPTGPFDAWPTGSGFEHFYGFVGGGTNQHEPALYEGAASVAPPKTAAEGYHLTGDLTDRAIAWIRRQRTLTPGHSFFCYFAPGATPRSPPGTRSPPSAPLVTIVHRCYRHVVARPPGGVMASPSVRRPGGSVL